MKAKKLRFFLRQSYDLFAGRSVAVADKNLTGKTKLRTVGLACSSTRKNRMQLNNEWEFEWKTGIARAKR